MRRSLLQIFVGVAMLGGLTLVPSAAFASHGTTGSPANTPLAGTHEPMPDPVVQGANPCVVTGAVTTTSHALVDAAVSHGHYKFLDTSMLCANRPNLTSVDADGGFDGPDQPDPDNPGGFAHGSSNPIAWSNCSEYSGTGSPSAAAQDCPNGVSGTRADGANRNRGDITVVTTGACNGNGWVKFARVGLNVTAWGNNFNSPPDCPFSAELVFTPDYSAAANPPPATPCWAEVAPPHTHCYGLTGTALVG